MFMKILIKISLLILLVVFTNTTFSSSWILNNNIDTKFISPNNTLSWTNIQPDQIKTIKELKEEVRTIDEQKEISNKELDVLKKEILISRFFKTDLNPEEKFKLNNLVVEYKETKDKLNEQLLKQSQNLENTTETIKKLLENEKEIYKKLLNYINIEKYEEYKNFIKKDIIIINTNSNLESSILKKEAIIQNKVDDLKQKIEEHHNLLNKKLIDIVNEKIDLKLQELTEKKKFKQLDKESQLKLFWKLTSSIEKKITALESKENKTRLLIKKIELYKVIIKRIDLFKNNLFNLK